MLPTRCLSGEHVEKETVTTDSVSRNLPNSQLTELLTFILLLDEYFDTLYKRKKPANIEFAGF